MITYKISNQHIKIISCDQREYFTDLFTGNLEEKIKERTVNKEKDRMSRLGCSTTHHIKVSDGANAVRWLLRFFFLNPFSQSILVK